MSVDSIVTEQDLINLRNLAEQQKNQRAPKIKNSILKRTLGVKVAENLSPKTKKLDEVNRPTKRLGEIIKESNSRNEKNQEIVPVENGSDDSEGDNAKLNIRALPNSSVFSELMRKKLGSLLSSSKSLRKIFSFWRNNPRSSYIYSRW